MSNVSAIHKGKICRVFTTKPRRKPSAKALFLTPEVDPLLSSVAERITPKELRVPPIEAHQFTPTPRNEAQQVDDYVY